MKLRLLILGLLELESLITSRNVFSLLFGFVKQAKNSLTFSMDRCLWDYIFIQKNIKICYILYYTYIYIYTILYRYIYISQYKKNAHNDISKSRLKAELCFHHYVHFSFVPINNFGFHHKQFASN